MWECANAVEGSGAAGNSFTLGRALRGSNVVLEEVAIIGIALPPARSSSAAQTERRQV